MNADNAQSAKDSPVWGCAACARLGKTCCQAREIFVTQGDRDRIATYVGQKDFWEYRIPTDPSYLDQDNDPLWRRFVFGPDNSRPVLKRRPDGDCSFLGTSGCTLPMEIRPLVCRLYPHAYTAIGIDGVAEGCPEAVIPAGRSILQVLDMRLVDAVRWHKMLYQEIQVRTASSEHRIDIRLAG